MEHHTIELKDLQQWLIENEATFASSSRERKTLNVNMSGGYVIRIAGQKVWEGMQPFTAVEKYNSISEKYIEVKKDFTL